MEYSRFAVTVERELVIYANSKEEAETKALTYLQSVSTETPAARPMKVVDVTLLETVDKEVNGVPVGVSIDIAPARETR